MAEIWDPHPQYVIEAFGRQIVLELEYNDRFLAPALHVFVNYLQKNVKLFFFSQFTGEPCLG